MSDAPFMQLYVADYLGDTLHLTTEQHGAYLLLLMAMWRAGGALPNDPKKLARIARVSPRRWHLIAEEVMAFFTVDDDEITQKRLKREREKADSISEKRSAAGKAGAEAKALKDKESASANAEQLPQHSQIPEPYKSPNGDNARARRGQPNRFQEFWEAYPDRSGSNPRKPAEKKFTAAVKAGTDPDTIIAGAKAYAAASRADGSFGTPYVAQAQTWLNQARWEQYAGTAPKQATPDEIERHNREAAEREAYWLARIAEDEADGSAEGSPGIGVGEGGSDADAGELGQGEGGELQSGTVGEQRGRVRSFQGPDDNDIRRRCEDAPDGGQPAMGRMVSLPPDGGSEALRVRGALQPLSRSVGAILACAGGVSPDWEQ